MKLLIDIARMGTQVYCLVNVWCRCERGTNFPVLLNLLLLL